MKMLAAHSASLLLVLLASTVHGFDLFGKKKGGHAYGGHDEACSVVQDDVWEEKCRTLFDNACEEDSVEQCKLVPQRQCKTVHEEECSLVVREKCKHIDVPKCDIVWEKKCVWERECRVVPSPKPCHVSKKKVAGFLPRLWKRSLDKLGLKSGKAYGKKHGGGHKKGKKVVDYAPVPERITLETEACEPDSEICEDVEKCKDYPGKQCSVEPKQKCLPLPDKECHAVPREHCQDINVEVCRPVPRTTCRSVPRKECEKQLVQRPRQVCLPPPVVTVKAEEVVW